MSQHPEVMQTCIDVISELGTGSGGTRNISGKLTITLMQTSESNSVLESRMIADDATSQGYFAWTLVNQDYKGIVQSTSAWVMKPATLEYGRELNDRTWEIDCGDVIYLNAYSVEAGEAVTE